VAVTNNGQNNGENTQGRGARQRQHQHPTAGENLKQETTKMGICDGDTFSNKSQYGDTQWSPYWIGYVRHNLFRRSIRSKPKL
jgi:hypothetical protein